MKIRGIQSGVSRRKNHSKIWFAHESSFLFALFSSRTVYLFFLINVRINQLAQQSNLIRSFASLIPVLMIAQYKSSLLRSKESSDVCLRNRFPFLKPSMEKIPTRFYHVANFSVFLEYHNQTCFSTIITKCKRNKDSCIHGAGLEEFSLHKSWHSMAFRRYYNISKFDFYRIALISREFKHWSTCVREFNINDCIFLVQYSEYSTKSIRKITKEIKNLL